MFSLASAWFCFPAPCGSVLATSYLYSIPTYYNNFDIIHKISEFVKNSVHIVLTVIFVHYVVI
jgi:hypothetical protein